jgi:hypothetical protein
MTPDDPIDLNQRRAARERPDAEFVAKDDFGRPLYTFGYSFDHSDGKTYGFRFVAYDFEDAEAKLASIRGTARLDGQIFTEVPA